MSRFRFHLYRKSGRDAVGNPVFYTNRLLVVGLLGHFIYLELSR